MPILITLRDLIDVDACLGQRSMFHRLFGQQVVATVTTAVAHADEFDWVWAAQSFLRGEHYDAYSADARTWDYDLWRDDYGGVTPDGHRAAARHLAAAFAKAFLAQGGITHPRRG